ncbi:MAG TPA: cytochrome c biogenesis protein ResB [Deltaproteobacteria bacterium]|nr:cytochrome c biogenesis protein ResB [Deltaproteobacteria bacterium]
MYRFSRIQMWVTLILLAILGICSIVGAFYGAEWSKALFNSAPMIVFWFVLMLIFIFALFRSHRMRKAPGLVMMHAACVMVLLGSMWGSDGGHLLRSDLLHTDKVPGGYMSIYEGHSENHIMSRYNGDKLTELPFSIYLKDFWMDYYWDDGRLLVRSPQGRIHVVHAVPSHAIEPGEGIAKLRIVRVFKNLKVIGQKDAPEVVDDPGIGSNPALEIEVSRSDGTRERRYVFQRFPQRNLIPDGWATQYALGIKDFFSDLSVVQDEEVSDHKVIQVNDPLHYGGYYFYQASYDASHGRYTVLSVTSDSGHAFVFTGFFFLCLGVFWHFWVQPVYKRSSNRRARGD